MPDGSSGNKSALDSFAAVTTSQAVESTKRNSAGGDPYKDTFCTRFAHVSRRPWHDLSTFSGFSESVPCFGELPLNAKENVTSKCQPITPVR